MDITDLNARMVPEFGNNTPQMIEWRSLNKNEYGASEMQTEDIDDESFRVLYSDGTVYVYYYHSINENGKFKNKLIGRVDIGILSEVAKNLKVKHNFFNIDKLLEKSIKE